MVVKRMVIIALVASWSAYGGTPHVPPRDYSKEATVILGDEAMVLARATDAALKHLRKRAPKATLAAYFAHIERRSPSAWVVTWMLNDIDARGGGVEVTLDATGEKVVSVQDLE